VKYGYLQGQFSIDCCTIGLIVAAAGGEVQTGLSALTAARLTFVGGR
jgi:hypothetical protein